MHFLSTAQYSFLSSEGKIGLRSRVKMRCVCIDVIYIFTSCHLLFGSAYFKKSASKSFP